MNTEILRAIEGVIVLAGVASVFMAVLRSNTTKQTIQSQKELIDTLTVQVNELRKLHEENSKEIGRLIGQVEVYKELPLSTIAASMETIVKTQEKILNKLNKG